VKRLMGVEAFIYAKCANLSWLALLHMYPVVCSL
jgi:hypothetical protein